MSQTSSTPNQRLVTELKVSAHLMLLDPGVFCIFHGPGNHSPDPATGLPGVRVTRPPSTPAEVVSISTFNPDGWLGGENGAALVRISGAQAQVLVTIYQSASSTQEAPKLQVLRLSEQSAPQEQAQVAAAAPSGAAAPAAGAVSADKPEVAAHVQRRGDLLTRIGDWMGERGSQNWIEGFAIQPSRLVEPGDVEYQAVLGKGWLSPWAEGGKYCGSRGMALPILGLRVRLKGEAAESFAVRVHATFIDGSSIGPIDGSQTAETESLAPLEAFKVEFVPLDGADDARQGETAAADVKPSPAPALAKPARAAAPRSAPRPVQAGTHPSAKGSVRPQKPSRTGRPR